MFAKCMVWNPAGTFQDPCKRILNPVERNDLLFSYMI